MWISRTALVGIVMLSFALLIPANAQGNPFVLTVSPTGLTGSPGGSGTLTTSCTLNGSPTSCGTVRASSANSNVASVQSSSPTATAIKYVAAGSTTVTLQATKQPYISNAVQVPVTVK